MMNRAPRGVQKGCGGFGGGGGGGVNIGAGVSAEMKLSNGLPWTSFIRTLPRSKGASYQVLHTRMFQTMLLNGNACPGRQLWGCAANGSACATPAASPAAAMVPASSAPA